MSIRANRWVEEVLELLRGRAMISTEIAERT